MDDPQLTAIQAAETSGDHATAVTLSDTYVSANPTVFTTWAAMSIEDCVTAVDAFRSSSMDTEQWQMQAWIYHHFAFQNIGGTYQPQIRIA